MPAVGYQEMYKNFEKCNLFLPMKQCGSSLQSRFDDLSRFASLFFIEYSLQTRSSLKLVNGKAGTLPYLATLYTILHTGQIYQ